MASPSPSTGHSPNPSEDTKSDGASRSDASKSISGMKSSSGEGSKISGSESGCDASGGDGKSASDSEHTKDLSKDSEQESDVDILGFSDSVMKEGSCEPDSDARTKDSSSGSEFARQLRDCLSEDERKRKLGVVGMSDAGTSRQVAAKLSDCSSPSLSRPTASSSLKIAASSSSAEHSTDSSSHTGTGNSSPAAPSPPAVPSSPVEYAQQARDILAPLSLPADPSSLMISASSSSATTGTGNSSLAASSSPVAPSSPSAPSSTSQTDSETPGSSEDTSSPASSPTSTLAPTELVWSLVANSLESKNRLSRGLYMIRWTNQIWN